MEVGVIIALDPENVDHFIVLSIDGPAPPGFVA